jgi:hypothetical protein
MVKAAEAKAESAPEAEHSPLFHKADPQRLQSAEAARLCWCYTAGVGTRIEDLLQPQFWAQLGPQRPGAWDRLEVREETGRWWAEFLVIESGPGHLVLRGIKGLADLGPVGPRHIVPFDAEGLRVEHLGAHLQWAVLRRDSAGVDHQVIGGFRDEAQAQAWLKDHIRMRNS